MKNIQKALSWIADFFEIYLPIIAFVSMFIVFLTNILFRYIFKNPQNWTFEFSINAFIVAGLLGATTAYRKEDHVVFDLIYTKLNEKWKNIFRIISYVLIISSFSFAIPKTITYLVNLPAITPIMRIPTKFIFSVFPILLISILFRSFYRLILDIKAFKKKTYVQLYNTEEDTLI